MEGRAHVCRNRKGRKVMVFRKPEAQVERVLRRRFGWVRSPTVLREYSAVLLDVAVWMRERGYMQGVDSLEWDQAQELMAEKLQEWYEAKAEMLCKALDRLPGVRGKTALCWSGKLAERQMGRRENTEKTPGHILARPEKTASGQF